MFKKIGISCILAVLALNLNLPINNIKSQAVSPTSTSEIDNDVIDHGTLDGKEYQMQLIYDRTKVIDVVRETRRPVIWRDHKGNNQIWTFKYDKEKDAYQIYANDGSNQAIAWEGKGGSPTRVVCPPNKQYAAYYWKVEKASDGSYIIRSYSDPNFVLSVPSSDQGANLQVRQFHGYKSSEIATQKFELSGYEYFPGSKEIKEQNIDHGTLDGKEYQMRLSSTKKTIDVEWSTRQVLIWQNHNGSNQKWKFVYDKSKEAYQIYTKDGTNQVIAWDKNAGSTRVVCAPNRKYDAYYWKVEDLGNNEYIIRNYANPHVVLTVDRGATKDGTKIKNSGFYGYDSDYDSQKFFLTQDKYYKNVRNFECIGMNKNGSPIYKSTSYYINGSGPHAVLLYLDYKVVSSYKGKSIYKVYDDRTGKLIGSGYGDPNCFVIDKYLVGGLYGPLKYHIEIEGEEPGFELANIYSNVYSYL
ncbi:RICIN domain-containing protein [Listeria sp. PSOL-1]|uniref:RICIN domain-containing protein n=1 Tax=Listeria sp. PSOL-1 TaxID=1844999 RepID=UPI0013D17582|nr:RICIN domain-containing protein [Listeria sp. PSOL-1]